MKQPAGAIRWRGRGWRFAAPWLVGVVGLTVLPLGASLVLSGVRWDGLADLDDIEWVGGQHYLQAMGMRADATPTANDPWYVQRWGSVPLDRRVYQSLYNSLVYSTFAIPLGLGVSLALALLLNLNVPGISIFRTLYYLPHVLGGVATIVIWSWLFNPKFGPINGVIRSVYWLLDPLVCFLGGDGTDGWATPDWLYSPAFAKPAVIIMQAWTAGGTMLIFLAALRSIDHSMLEAARIDGAGRRRRFRHIILPQISPAILFNLVLGWIYSMQAFSQSYLLYNRAQDDGLLFYVLYLYRCAFESPYRLGYASALAWILVAVLAVPTAVIYLTRRRWVHYEAEVT